MIHHHADSSSWWTTNLSSWYQILLRKNKHSTLAKEMIKTNMRRSKVNLNLKPNLQGGQRWPESTIITPQQKNTPASSATVPRDFQKAPVSPTLNVDQEGVSHKDKTCLRNSQLLNKANNGVSPLRARSKGQRLPLLTMSAEKPVRSSACRAKRQKTLYKLQLSFPWNQISPLHIFFVSQRPEKAALFLQVG